MAKKIEVIVDINTEKVEISSDRVLTLTEQVRILKKEIQKTGPGPEQDLLIQKFNDVNDELDKTNLKSREFLGALGTLPGPVGTFASSLDGAVNQLRNFSSFSFKDIKTQLGGLVDDFGKIVTNIGKATGITKLYTTLNGALANSFKAVGVAEGIAATGAKALAGALTATGVGALVVAIGYLVGKIMEWASSTEEADTANESLNNTLKLQNDLIAKNAKDIENFSKQDVLRAKIAGKTEKEIYNIQVQANKDLLANRIQANNDAYSELQKFNKKQGDYAKLTEDQRKEMGVKLVENEKKTYDAITDQITSNGTFELEYQNTQAEKVRTKKQQETDKKLAANKQYQEKLTQDTKTATDMLLDYQQENAVLSLKTERERQDQELKNQKKDEEDKIKELKLKDTNINGVVVTGEELRKKLLEQVTQKYDAKNTEYTTKRNEEDLKLKDDFNKKVEEIRISAIKNETERIKEERQSKYDNDLKDLEADKEFIKKSEIEKAKIRKDLKTSLNNDLAKIDLDEKLKKDAIEKGDYDSKYQRIVAGAQNDLDLQRKLLEEKKISDEKYYKEQLGREGLTTDQIRELNERKLADQILYTEKSNQIERDRISVKQKALDDIISIAGAESDVGRAALIAKQILQAKEMIMEIKKTITFSTQAAARSTVAVAEGTAQTAKIGFPQNIPMLIGYAAQAVGIISAIMSAVNSAKSSASTTTDTGSVPTTPNMGKNYGDGGMINGPLHAQGGVMINAEGGEAVMTRGAVTMFGPLLSSLNQMGGGTSFSTGAMGGSRPDMASVSQPSQDKSPVIMKTYVVSNELTTESEKQARLKDLSTL
jgi:hypothetical protein